MKTLFNRIALLLSIAALTTQCKKDRDKNEPEAGSKDEWVVLSKDMKELGDDGWGFAAGNKIYLYDFNSWLDVYDVQQKKWTEEKINFPAEFQPRYNALLAQHNNKIYIAGGQGDDGKLKDFWEFNPANAEWKKLPDLPIPLTGGNIYVYNNILYAGMAATSPYNSQSQRWVFKYSFVTNTWDDTPIELNSFAGTDGITFQTGEDIFYGAGYGFTETAPNPKTFYKYNLRTGTHTQLANLPTTFIENARPNTFILNGKLYGVLDTRMLIYDPALNTWTQKDNVPEDEEGNGIYYSFKIGNRVISITRSGSTFEYL